MASETFVLPGDSINPSLIPTHTKKPLRLGPGLRHVPPSGIVPTIAGEVVTEHQKNAMRVENAGGRVRTTLTEIPNTVLLIPTYSIFPE